MSKDELYIKRAFDLAMLGAGQVSPNPRVGAVIVHKNKIIGEGWYEKDGGPHAEVNAVKSVLPEHKKLIKDSTIYVSLEPCCIYGRTPPCTNLIIEKKIQKVVISTIDKTDGVKGNGLQQLKDANITITTGVLEKLGTKISQYRNHFVSKNRPFVILKYAQSKDGFFAKEGEQVWLSNKFSKRLVHKWRSEVDAIMVGTNTARVDNPQLTNRKYFGKSPLRIVLDRNLSLDEKSYLLDDSTPTWIITSLSKLPSNKKNTNYHYLPFNDQLFESILKLLTCHGCTTLMVEGGSKLLKTVLKSELWDEIRILESNECLEEGIKAPDIFTEKIDEILDNNLRFIKKNP